MERNIRILEPSQNVITPESIVYQDTFVLEDDTSAIKVKTLIRDYIESKTILYGQIKFFDTTQHLTSEPTEDIIREIIFIGSTENLFP